MTLLVELGNELHWSQRNRRVTLRWILVLLALVAIVVLAGCGTDTSQFERYSQTCVERGGFVSQEAGWSYVKYWCVGQTSGPTLPVVTN